MVDANGTETRSCVPCALINPALHGFCSASLDMNLSDVYRDNDEDCAFLAERAEDGEVKRALKRMEEAWRTLAQEQEQLDNKRWSTKKPRL